MKRPLLPLFLLPALASCDYGMYCQIQNASRDSIKVTVVESVLQNKAAARHPSLANPGLDSFRLVARDQPGQENNRPVSNNVYEHTLASGRQLNVTSALAGHLIARIILTRGADTLTAIRHRRSDEADQKNYLLIVQDAAGAGPSHAAGPHPSG